MFISNEKFADFVLYDLLVDWSERAAIEKVCHLPGFVRDAFTAYETIKLLQDGETAYITVAWTMITTSLDPATVAAEYEGWHKSQHPIVYSVTRSKNNDSWEIHRGII